jgi:hypothetical protein
MMRRHLGCIVVAAVALLLRPLAGDAQPLSTADLADAWQVTYVATPTTPFTGLDLRAYKGTVTFNAAGAASGTIVADEFTPGALAFTVTGSLALTGQGLVTGTLVLTGLDARSLEVAEARILVNRHTIVGAATLTRPGATDTGLITLVRLTDQFFERQADLVGDWNFHEITPSSNLNGGDADWTRGSITFHQNGCSSADLFLSDGTVREQRDPADLTSFG